MFNFGQKRISCSELLYTVIAHKASPEWFDILLKEPGIDPNAKNDQGQTLAHFIVQELYKSQNEKEQNIYLKYLEYLLADAKSDVTLREYYNQILTIIVKQFSKSQQALADTQAIFTVLLKHVGQDTMRVENIHIPSADEINEIISTVNKELNLLVIKSASTANSSSSETEEQATDLATSGDVNIPNYP